ncbi:MAG: riboflavin synthase [Candidatus Andersenbacteria bacterium]
MFTGIIRDMGTITAVATAGNDRLLEIASSHADKFKPGDSVAVNGACLTVLKTTKSTWTIRLMQETLDRTNLGELVVGSRVNLERPLRASDTLDGHFVLGHVDGVCIIQNLTTVAGDTIVTFTPPPLLMRYLIPKGSVALDGVSLTVVDVTNTSFTVSIMPYTMQETTFGKAKPSQRINMEVDVLGKYVERLLKLRESTR